MADRRACEVASAMTRKVEDYLIERRRKAPLHLALLDPDKTNPDQAASISKYLESIGTDAILIGGSLGVDPGHTRKIIDNIHKASSLPVIIFPGDLTNISSNADAIFFMSLLNSDDPYYLFGAQVQGALLVKRYGLEPLPTGYIIIGYGGAAGFIGKARPIPWEQPLIAAAYAMAAEMLGMRFIYLEAGSGSPRPVPPEIIRSVRQSVSKAFLIVGGGIKEASDAVSAVSAGADAIVTGTLVERDPGKIEGIVRAIKKLT